jgi:hypothetical protein
MTTSYTCVSRRIVEQRKLSLPIAAVFSSDPLHLGVILLVADAPSPASSSS